MFTSNPKKPGCVNSGSERRKHSKIPPPNHPVALGDILTTTDLAELKQLARAQENGSARITNCQYLTSYNWVDTEYSVYTFYDRPSILIPGEPPAYAPPAEQVELQDDSTSRHKRPSDINSQRSPSTSYEPMFQAILQERPDFPLRGMDIIACRLTLENILRYVRGNAQPFRILVDVLGNTVFFRPCQNKPGFPSITLSRDNGYYSSYLEAFTTWSPEVEESSAHQRIINYQLGGMNLLVRFGVDGFLPDRIPLPDALPFNTPSNGRRTTDAGATSSMPPSFRHEFPYTRFSLGSTLRGTKKGRYIPQSALFDLKTQSITNSGSDPLVHEIPRLWLAQIPHLVVAHHQLGLFNSDTTRVIDAGDLVERWENDNQETLLRFTLMLKELVSYARNECHSFEICYQGAGERLQLRKQGALRFPILPFDIELKWNNGGEWM